MATTQLNQKQLEDNNFNYGIGRQAIINGNFDVWQRGTTSATIADATIVWTADHWYDYHADDGGTLPTLTRSRVALTAGDIPNAFYCSRLTTNGAGTSLGVSSLGVYVQKVENGTRYLCGDGKKVTVSFYAKSDIAGKKIGVYSVQNYGSGGSPTAQEYIYGTNWTLTTSWVKYSYTITTNTLVGKTFGTANDDSLSVAIAYTWGTTTDERVGATGAETYVGSGTIDIAQVQLCAGDVALPFMPKSYEEELRACKRYYYRIGSGVAYETYAVGTATTTTNARVVIAFPVEMRTIPTLEQDGTAAHYQVTDAATGVDCNAVPTLTGGQVSRVTTTVNFPVASGLTAGDAIIARNKNEVTAYLAFSAEL